MSETNMGVVQANHHDLIVFHCDSPYTTGENVTVQEEKLTNGVTQTTTKGTAASFSAIEISRIIQHHQDGRNSLSCFFEQVL